MYIQYNINICIFIYSKHKHKTQIHIINVQHLQLTYHVGVLVMNVLNIIYMMYTLTDSIYNSPIVWGYW